MDYRRRSERVLVLWAKIACRRPRIALLCGLAVVGVLASGLQDLTIDSSPESWLRKDDPARNAYDEFRKEFGYEDSLYVLVGTDDLFDRQFIERLQALHTELETELPFASEVTSILNARDVRGADDELIVEGLLDEWPMSDTELAVARDRAFANPLYEGTLISKARHHTAIVVDLLPEPDPRSRTLPNRTLNGAEGDLVADTVSRIITRHETEDFGIWISGRHPITTAIIHALEHDMQLFTGISLGVIAVLVILLFRRVAAAVQVFAVIASTLIGTFGMMGHAGYAITPAMQITPSFLVAIATAQAVHILAIFYLELRRSDSPIDATCNALAHSGPAVVLTSLTTGVCLLSFAYADLAVIVSFGITSAFGVMIALVATLGLLPPLLVLWPPEKDAGKKPRIETEARILAAIGDMSVRHPRRVVAAWTLLLIVATTYASGLRFEQKPLEWFAPDHPARIDIEHVNDVMGTGLSYEIVVDTGHSDGLYDPEILRRIDKTSALIQARPLGGLQVGRPVSIVDIIKETHQALNENRADYYAIPDEREPVAQELLLFEMSGSDDASNFVDHEYRKARMTVAVPIVDSFLMRDHLLAVTAAIRETIGNAAEVVVTGQVPLEARGGTALVTSMGKSYLLALVLLVPLMIALAGNVSLGLISMLPNVIPIVMAMGLMNFMSIRLDMFTTLIASLAIGVAVDDTIHLLHNFKRYHAMSGDVPSAIHWTLLSTGRALLFTSVILAVSFLTFTGAVMVSVRDFGIITAFAIAAAFLADMTLTPALITLTHRSKIVEVSNSRELGATPRVRMFRSPQPDPPVTPSGRGFFGGSDGQAATHTRADHREATTGRNRTQQG
jgi:predicted RND superfamily exporter protein